MKERTERKEGRRGSMEREMEMEGKKEQRECAAGIDSTINAKLIKKEKFFLNQILLGNKVR